MVFVGVVAVVERSLSDFLIVGNSGVCDVVVVVAVVGGGGGGGGGGVVVVVVVVVIVDFNFVAKEGEIKNK